MPLKLVFHKVECWMLLYLMVIILWCQLSDSRRQHRRRTTKPNPFTKKICLNIDNKFSLRAKHKSCFLRPDTGPCRADILQWYFDAKKNRCYRFWWGGCQGNGNRFESRDECGSYCIVNTSTPKVNVPHFCGLVFDYGTCFGYFNRWTWDKFSKVCRRRLYSGCGGNQNNFETREECYATCMTTPNNTLDHFNELTTCIPFKINAIL